MKRRYFLKAVALTGVAATFKWSDGLEIMAQNVKGYDLVAVLGGDPVTMFRKAIAEMGGMGKFVKKGQKVCVKPNIGWDRTPELAANTNPELVGEIVKQCLLAGAKEVVVFDHTCDEWRNCYRNSGIESAVNRAGGKIVPANEESYYREVDLPNGVKMKSTKIHEAILDSDVWINVPVLKMHGGAKMSISLKNLMGIVWDRRYFHSHNLQQCIADCNTLSKKPVLNVVDAFRVIRSNGPQGRTEADVALTKGLFISPDSVAIDTAAIKFYNQISEMDLENVEHVGKAEALKIGTTKIESLNVKRIKV
ncbi:MAG TPA: DUF362 domain-containing protein [Flavisolibacter sp.]|jgi:uncharacterized protein (DUF362 family)